MAKDKLALKIPAKLKKRLDELLIQIPDSLDINFNELIAAIAASALMYAEGDEISKTMYSGAESAFDSTMDLVNYFLPGSLDWNWGKGGAFWYLPEYVVDKEGRVPEFKDLVGSPHFTKLLIPTATRYSASPNYQEKRDEDRFLWIRRLRPNREPWIGPFSEWRLTPYRDDIYRFGEHVDPDKFVSTRGYENQQELAASMGMTLLGDRNTMWDVLVKWEGEWNEMLRWMSALAMPPVLIFGVPIIEKLIETAPEYLKGLAAVLEGAVPG